MTIPDILVVIATERKRQGALWAGDHGWGVGDLSSPAVEPIIKAAVLSEECGEVARAVLDRDHDALREELVQVAACAIAWLESL